MGQTAVERQRAYEGRLRQKGLERVAVWVPRRYVDELRDVAGRMKAGTWEPAERPEDDVAALMAAMRGQGDTWMQVAAKLDGQGIKPPRGEYWSESSARKYGGRRGVK